MTRAGSWIVVVSIIFAVLPLFLSYGAISVGHLIGCYADFQIVKACEVWGFSINAPLGLLSSVGILVLLTVPIGILCMIAGIIIYYVGVSKERNDAISDH